ncbi:MAG: nuclear transport factor 2 family protein [Balneolaceae bacterium]|nr:nuclear transport factor 2 family protein [Balneolaceae bacterium]MBO6546575.1 nuclear transport factor 2 family protein [Balneolaceae bacterium]MBO6648934.1 nuclear transport factor 2 family protein [Balneolaceae bacterium]
MKSVLLFTILLFSIQVQSQTNEIDAFWDEVSRTVAEGDFEGYSATYHPDAILVNGMSETSYPISQALAGWKQGFDDTKAGTMKAGVEFRFDQRLHGETTAHDSGIFRYWSQNEGEELQVFIAKFEGLLVKKSGEWKMMMEYQISQATEEEWDSLK